ncbi:MAG: hypothetical protein ACTHVY_08400 [Brevibacterium yomogidense]
MDVRLSWSIVLLAAGAHVVCTIVTLTSGFLLVPATTVLMGTAAASLTSLLTALLLHVAVDAVFVVAMRRIEASVATCSVNLLVAHLPVVLIGVGLAALGGAVRTPAAADAATAAWTGLLVQAGVHTAWALLAVALGTGAGLVWVRVRA